MVWAVSLSTTKLSPRRLTQMPPLLAFAVWLGLVTSTWPRAHAALYLQEAYAWLHLNAFRGEPAISEFVWHFTSTHSSSNRFATRDSAGLHAPLRALHPGHG